MGSKGINSKLVELRRRYTGEYNSTALTAVRASRDVLDSDEVEYAVKYLDRPTPELDGDRAGLRRVGAAIIPSSDDPDQQALEAKMFRAANRATTSAFYFPPMRHMRRMHAIGAVIPSTDFSSAPLTVRLSAPHMLGPLLDRLLPAEYYDDDYPDDECILGLPGLRPEFRNKIVSLRLMHTNARVDIANIGGKNDLAAAIQFCRDSLNSGEERPKSSWLTHPISMTVKEARLFDLRGSRRVESAVYSQLLRRIGVFSPSLRVGSWRTSTGIIFEWVGRLDPATVADQLLHPIAGITGFDTVTVRASAIARLQGDLWFTDRSRDEARITLRRQDWLPLEDDIVQKWRGPVAVQNWVASRAGVHAAQKYADGAMWRRSRATGERTPLVPLGSSGTVADLDHCSPEQMYFRAVFALHMFNDGPGSDARFTLSRISQISRYPMIFSPHWDNLVIISHESEKIVGRLLSRDGSSVGLAGLRLLRVDHHGIHHFVQLSTGARLTVMGLEGSGNSLPRPPAVDSERALTLAVPPLSPQEQARISTWPELPCDDRRLLGAVLIRMSARSPEGLWALGTWLNDPLQRDPHLVGGRPRRLSYQKGIWELTWSKFPYLYDVAASLSDHYIPLRGSILRENIRTVTVTVGSASLVLRGPGDPSVDDRSALAGKS